MPHGGGFGGGHFGGGGFGGGHFGGSGFSGGHFGGGGSGFGGAHSSGFGGGHHGGHSGGGHGRSGGGHRGGGHGGGHGGGRHGGGSMLRGGGHKAMHSFRGRGPGFGRCMIIGAPYPFYGGAFATGLLLGGYLSPYPYYLRPRWACPLWYSPWYAFAPVYYPVPWWAHPAPEQVAQPASTTTRRVKPCEVVPVVIFDVGRSRMCGKLDRPINAFEHQHEVPMEELDVRLKVWEAPLHNAWTSSTPDGYKSVAAAIVLYQVSERGSFEAAQQWCEAAELLKETELEKSGCFTIFLVGVTPDADNTEQTGGKAKVVVTTHPQRTVLPDEAIAFASSRGYIAIDAPCSTAERVHDLMATVAQLCLQRAAESREAQQAKDKALMELAEVMKKGEGFMNTVNVDELWRAVDAASRSGVDAAQLEPAQRKLDELTSAELKGGDDGNFFSNLFCAASRKDPNSRRVAAPAATPAPTEAASEVPMGFAVPVGVPVSSPINNEASTTEASSSTHTTEATDFEARVALLQVEYFAEDLQPPQEAQLWSEASLRLFFESGGLEVPAATLDPLL